MPAVTNVRHRAKIGKKYPTRLMNAPVHDDSPIEPRYACGAETHLTIFGVPSPYICERKAGPQSLANT